MNKSEFTMKMKGNSNFDNFETKEHVQFLAPFYLLQNNHENIHYNIMGMR